MSIASCFARRRRALVFGSAIFLLHWAALVWLEGHVRPSRVLTHAAAGQLVVAQVEPGPRAEPPPPPKPRRIALPPPPPVKAPAPPVVEVLPEPVVGQAPPPEELAPVGVVAAAQEGASAGDAAVQPEPVAEAPPAPEARAYRAEVPPSADMTMAVDRVDADGTRWSGEALISWKLDGANYRLQVEAGIRVLFARVNLVLLDSEGTVTGSGFAPARMTEKRRGRALTATHFNREGGKITFSASQQAFPLLPGAQDKASVPLQLAAIARADPAQLSGDIDIQVGEDKDASVYRFEVVGQEEIETGLGRMQTWHLSRPPKPGSYKSRLDVWLAPGRGWYPVRIRNTEANGAVTTQTVNKIVMTDTGS